MRVVLAEDLYLLRTGLERLLNAHGFDVIESVDNGPALLHALVHQKPDVAVVDVRLPPTFTDEGLRAAIEARRQVPPYLPISLSGCQTIGSAGMRCSTGGSLPAFTWSASIGASENCFGHFAGSVIMVGPCSSPTSPDAARSPAAWAAWVSKATAAGLAAIADKRPRRDRRVLGLGVSPEVIVAPSLQVA